MTIARTLSQTAFFAACFFVSACGSSFASQCINIGGTVGSGCCPRYECGVLVEQDICDCEGNNNICRCPVGHQFVEGQGCIVDASCAAREQGQTCRAGQGGRTVVGVCAPGLSCQDSEHYGYRCEPE